MNGKTLGVCVIGLGIGLEHARAYAKMKDIDLYVCDTDQHRVAQARRELTSAGSFDSIDAAIAAGSVDAVDICLPNSLHGPVAISAARKGKHCLIEKPFATTLGEADRVIDESRKNGTVLCVGENWQFSPYNLKAAALIAEGQIGETFLVSVQSEMWPVHFPRTSWWFRRDLAGGGVLLCAGVHAIRSLRMLEQSDITSVYATGSNISLGIESEDTCTVSLTFQSGALGLVVASWATPKPCSLFEVHGSKGTIIRPRGERGLLFKSDTLTSDGTTHVEIDEINTIEEECKVFVESARTGSADDRVSADQGRMDLEVVEAAYRSMASHTLVRL